MSRKKLKRTLTGILQHTDFHTDSMFKKKKKSVSRLLSFPDVINWLNVGSLMFSNYIYLISLQCLYQLKTVGSDLKTSIKDFSKKQNYLS